MLFFNRKYIRFLLNHSVEALIEISGIAVRHAAYKIRNQKKPQIQLFFLTPAPSGAEMIRLTVVFGNQGHQLFFHHVQLQIRVIVNDCRHEAVQKKFQDRPR